MRPPTDPAENLAALIRCPSVTPADEGALAVLGSMLEPLGFAVDRPVFSEAGTPDIENLYAKLPGDGRRLMFAGHTDVVPPGDESAWRHPPFSAATENGEMYGRGAVDMKGGIACFVAAIARYTERRGRLPGSVSLLITGDEEGPALNGTVKLLEWATGRGERWDGAIVGEPTNPERLGEMIKIGRRGSMSGTVTVNGTQGHAAYPHLADNPLPGLLALAGALIDTPFDEGTEAFQPTNLEITSVDTGNPATNVIPARGRLLFNVRFNDRWTADSLKAEIGQRLAHAANAAAARRAGAPIDFVLEWRDRPSPVFLTRDVTLTELLSDAVRSVTGLVPELSTSGGTSDARFIKDYCPVVEFGLVGRTMHKIDERVALADLETLTAIYQRFLESWFGD